MFFINMWLHLEQEKLSLNSATQLMWNLGKYHQYKIQTTQRRLQKIIYWYQISWNIFPSINMFIMLWKIGSCYPTACVYQFIGGDTEWKPNMLIFFFSGLALCIEIKGYVAHIFYGWNMSHNTTINFCIIMENIFISWLV